MKKTEVLRKLTISINPKDLSTEKTISQILKKKGIKQKVKEYLDWLKKEYPSAGGGIDKVWNSQRTQDESKDYSDETEASDWLIFIRNFTNDKTTIESIKKAAKEKLKNEIFSSNAADGDVKKDLKTQPIASLLTDFDLYKGDEIAYAVELCKGFYLEWLPKWIEEGLKEKKPILTLNDLDKKSWEQIRKKIFTDLYASWKKTADENEIDKLKKKLGDDIIELSGLIEKAQEKVVRELAADKEKYKKERSDGNPWNLTDEEKRKIDQTADKQELEKIVAEIIKEKDSINPQDLARINDWIEKNISNKTRPEDLPTKADIEKVLGSTKFPPGFKEKIEQTLWKKKNELTPEPATFQGKIKELLVWFQERVGFLKKGVGGNTEVKAFKKHSEAKIDQIMPLVDKALKTDTLEGYKLLDKEWLELKNKELSEKNENYNFKFDYFGVWKTLKGHLEEEAKETKYNDLVKQVKGELGKNLGEQFLEIWEFKVEVKKD